MAAYVVVQVNVNDADKYDEYKNFAQKSVAKHGGKYIVRGGEQEDLEGSLPFSRMVILEFQTLDQARIWYNSPEYQHAKSVRAGASDGIFSLVEGL